MKTKTVLYPKPRASKKVIKWGKKVTVPNQAMSLAEIIRRFTRKEALPIEKEGLYEDRFGDIEALSREDITVRKERAEELRNWANLGEQRYNEEQKRLAEEKAIEDEKAFNAKVKALQDQSKNDPPDKPKP